MLHRLLAESMLNASQSDALITRIYEAAIVEEGWPKVLQEIADSVGAAGAAFVFRSPTRASAIFSTAIEEVGHAYAAEGWLADTEVADPLYREQYPGFRAESDYRTAEAIAALPVHRKFLDPRGFIAGAATIFQGPLDDILHMTVEGFASHEASQRAKPILDQLRPHVGRALSLTAQLAQREDQAMVESLDLIGAGAAIVNTSGRLRAANDRFRKQLRADMIELRSRIHFTNSFLDAQFRSVLDGTTPVGKIASIGLRRQDERPIVIHMIPIVAKARDRLGSDGILMLVAESENVSIPDGDLLRLLFDLTPTEALLTRNIVEGATLADVAVARGVSEATVRTQLKSIFHKTGVSRQADLLRLLLGLSI